MSNTTNSLITDNQKADSDFQQQNDTQNQTQMATQISVPQSQSAIVPDTSTKQCENCGFELDGPFCGRCGQPERSTIAFFGAVVMHFLDDIFGFDSRASRTVLPLIFRPGFLTCEYFGGRRVHYVPPLRLYFFVSIVFFIMLKFVTDDSVKELQQFQQSQEQVSVAYLSKQIDLLQQKVDVEKDGASQYELRQLENLRKQKQQVIDSINVKILGLREKIKLHNPEQLPMEQLSLEQQIKIETFQQTIDVLQLNLDEHPNLDEIRHIDEKLRRLSEVQSLPGYQLSEEDKVKRTSLEQQKTQLLARETIVNQEEQQNERPGVFINIQPQFSWLSEAQNKQLEIFIADLEQKAKVAVTQDAAPLIKQMLEVLPQMMFFLLPIFALILKIFYLFSKRFYMEHLTVALHSHAFIFTILMMVAALSSWIEYMGTDYQNVKHYTEIVVAALFAWMPIYLFLMQKKVYRQGVIMTFLKYGLVGMTYMVLLFLATAITFFWGLAKV